MCHRFPPRPIARRPRLRSLRRQGLHRALLGLAFLVPLVAAEASRATWLEGVDWKVVFPQVVNELCNDPDGPGKIPRIYELLRDVDVDLSKAIGLSELPHTLDPTSLVRYRDNGLPWKLAMIDRLDEWATHDIDAHKPFYRLYNTLIDTRPDEMSGVVLELKRGFRWDGPSIPALGGCNPPGWRTELMRASAVHDALYDWMRLQLIAKA